MDKNYNKPTEILKQEHRIIEKALILIDNSVRKIEQNNVILPKDVFIKLIDFIKNFADACHHAKEENILFPFLIKKGLPKDSGPVGVMLIEHTQGREFIRKFQSCIDEYYSGKKEEYITLKTTALSYTELLKQHIFKEDNILFPLADRMFSNEDTEIILKQFTEAEEKFNKDKNIQCHCYYTALLEDVKNKIILIDDDGIKTLN